MRAVPGYHQRDSLRVLNLNVGLPPVNWVEGVNTQILSNAQMRLKTRLQILQVSLTSVQMKCFNKYRNCLGGVNFLVPAPSLTSIQVSQLCRAPSTKLTKSIYIYIYTHKMIRQTVWVEINLLPPVSVFSPVSVRDTVFIQNIVFVLARTWKDAKRRSVVQFGCFTETP